MTPMMACCDALTGWTMHTRMLDVPASIQCVDAVNAPKLQSRCDRGPWHKLAGRRYVWALLRWVRIGPVRLPCPSLTVLVQLCQSAADTQPRPKHQGEFERGTHGATAHTGADER